MSSSSGDDDDDAPRVAAASAAAAARVPAKRAKSVDVSGFLHNGVMYLRDRDSDAVYQTERDTKGNLVQLGRWIDGQPLFFAAPKQLDNDDDAEAEAPPALSKRQRKELALAQLVTRVLPPLNFVVTDVADHAETGIKAYRDVKFVLDALAAVTGKPQPEIYDPYFCTGRVKEHLAKVGYTAVYNENEFVVLLRVPLECDDEKRKEAHTHATPKYAQRLLRQDCERLARIRRCLNQPTVLGGPH